MINPRIFRLFAMAGACFLLFVTFMSGVYVGAYQFNAMDASGRAALLVFELSALRHGSADKLINTKELDLDSAIVKALRFQESGHPWLFFPFSESYVHSEYLKIAAVYRKKHPSPTPSVDFGSMPDLQEEMAAYAAEVAKRMEQLQHRYGG